MSQTDLVLLHAPHVYDFRQVPQLYGPVSDLVPSTPVFEMYPVGFASIAQRLERAGYRVRIVNLALRMLRDRRFDAEAFIKKLEAPVFGLDLHWLVHAHGAIEVARLVKKHHPASMVVFGGFSASYFYRQLIAYPEVDCVMRGDSTEEPMLKLMQALPGHRLGDVPNLTWKDRAGRIHENTTSHVPDSISGIAADNYSGLVRSVFRHRDLLSLVPFKGWLSYPVLPVFTSRGCNRGCVFCGGSLAAMRLVVGRKEAAFRSPQDIFSDIKGISRLSRGPIFILGDIREAGEEKAIELLSLLHQKPVSNRLMFELFIPAPPRFIEELTQAAPGFTLDISPHSHDPEVRRALRLSYPNEELEAMLGSALKLGCSRMSVFFMVGLPRQTRESVLATVDYCERLLRRFDGDRRLQFFIGPLAPFLDPGSPAFEHPARHGYRLLCRTLEEHRQASLRPAGATP